MIVSRRSAARHNGGNLAPHEFFPREGNGTASGTRTKPGSDFHFLGDGIPKSAEYRGTDRLLLSTKVILKQLVAGDISSVNAGDGVVHQHSGVQLRHACGRCHSAERLAQFVAPFR